MKKQKEKTVGFGLVALCIVTIVALTFLGFSAVRLWENPVPSSGASEEATLSGLYSKNAVLLARGKGNVIAEQQGSARIYPASLTKIMTAVVALDEIRDLNAKIEVPSAIFPELTKEDASLAGFAAGESARAIDLVYGALLPSGAECCLALAQKAAGSEEAFVKMMNEKARKLGMTGTHFTNSTGLHHTNHYSTAEDIAKLLDEALKNETFRKAFTCKKYSVAPTIQHPKGFTFENSMFRLMDNTTVAGGKILGGKTGYTSEAGLCLASLASIRGKEYILVTAGAAGTHQTQQYHIMDAFAVYGQLG